MSRHLGSCPQVQEAVSKADQGDGEIQDIFRLRVRDMYLVDFWLHLEMTGNATLAELDHYLRAIWLECCGHMSQFSFGGWRGEEIRMSAEIGQVFELGDELTHIYDFGTSSETLIKVVGERRGIPLTPHPIALLARNDMPEAECIECGRPASYLCMECLYEHDTYGTLCDKHADVHEHEDYGDPVPLLNSPRVGMCGYDGPAVQPY